MAANGAGAIDPDNHHYFLTQKDGGLHLGASVQRKWVVAMCGECHWYNWFGCSCIILGIELELDTDASNCLLFQNDKEQKSVAV